VRCTERGEGEGKKNLVYGSGKKARRQGRKSRAGSERGESFPGISKGNLDLVGRGEKGRLAEGRKRREQALKVRGGEENSFTLPRTKKKNVHEKERRPFSISKGKCDAKEGLQWPEGEERDSIPSSKEKRGIRDRGEKKKKAWRCRGGKKGYYERRRIEGQSKKKKRILHIRIEGERGAIINEKERKENVYS